VGIGGELAESQDASCRKGLKRWKKRAFFPWVALAVCKGKATGGRKIAEERYSAYFAVVLEVQEKIRRSFSRRQSS